jgi:hypothetical protein
MFCFPKISIFQNKHFPVIWLEIMLELISRIASQKIGHFKNGFAFLKTFLVKFSKKFREDHFKLKFLIHDFLKHNRKSPTVARKFVGPTFYTVLNALVEVLFNISFYWHLQELYITFYLIF